MKSNSKSWPQTGDIYFFVSDDLCVGRDKVTANELSDAFGRQIVRRMVGNFFKTFEEANEMADKAYELFNF